MRWAYLKYLERNPQGFCLGGHKIISNQIQTSQFCKTLETLEGG
jgi:hypothetical protein